MVPNDPARFIYEVRSKSSRIIIRFFINLRVIATRRRSRNVRLVRFFPDSVHRRESSSNSRKSKNVRCAGSSRKKTADEKSRTNRDERVVATEQPTGGGFRHVSTPVASENTVSTNDFWRAHFGLSAIAFRCVSAKDLPNARTIDVLCPFTISIRITLTSARRLVSGGTFWTDLVQYYILSLYMSRPLNIPIALLLLFL